MNTNQKNIIIEWVKTAGLKIKEYVWKINKESMSKITAFDYWIPADKISETVILQAIKDSKLDCKIISEESEIIWQDNAEYTIYLDPLDGSINFSRGIPVFCIGLWIYKNNKPILGVVYDISMDEMFIADIWNWISLNWKPLKSNIFDSNILINIERSWAPNYDKTVWKLKENYIRTRTAGSGVLALCYGSIGRWDWSILLDNKPRDIAPWLVFAVENWYIIKQINWEDVNLSIHSQNLIAAPQKIFDKLKEIIN